MKQKEFNNNMIFAIVIIGFLLIASIITICYNEYKINEMKEEIASMPHYECLVEMVTVNSTERIPIDVIEYMTFCNGDAITGEITCEHKYIRENCKLNKDAYRDK